MRNRASGAASFASKSVGILKDIMIITGIQPTGHIHIGNYLGAIKPLVSMQDDSTFVFVADYHAITAKFDNIRMSSNTLASMLVACGVRANIFRQSDVPEHTELAHILGCTAARVGQLNRMIQFKEKMETLAEHKETPSVGIFTYPVLQAADILLYQGAEPTKVPVGDDQGQHLNLVVDIANSFNHRFGQTFVVPTPVISSSPRIMSLYDGNKKMSKSDPDDMNRINMVDGPDLIRKKIRKATTDSGYIPATIEELGNRVCLRNLLMIYGAFSDKSLLECVEHFSGKGFGPLKNELTDLIISVLEPIQHKVVSDVDVILCAGAENARSHASKTLTKVKSAIGF